MVSANALTDRIGPLSVAARPRRRAYVSWKELVNVCRIRSISKQVRSQHPLVLQRLTEIALLGLVHEGRLQRRARCYKEFVILRTFERAGDVLLRFIDVGNHLEIRLELGASLFADGSISRSVTSAFCGSFQTRSLGLFARLR